MKRPLILNLVKDSNDALSRIPKSQELRRSILEKSIAILDSISQEDTKDAELLNELADAYEKLAHLRNWNFRETEKSIAEYQKALRLRERSLELSDKKVEIRNKMILALGGLMEVYAINGDGGKVLELSRKIRSNYDEISRLEPENTKSLHGLSVEAERLSDTLKSAEREKESLEELQNGFSFIERAIGIRQKNIRTSEQKIELVSLWMQKGNLLEKLKRDDEALKIYKDASELALKTYQNDGSQLFAFNHTARTHRLIGDIFKRKGDFSKALKEYQFSLDLITNNLNNPKLDGRNLNYGQAIYNLRIGAMLGKLGKRKEAGKQIEEGLEIFRERLKTYSDDASEILYAPELLEVASDYYIENGETEKGLKIWDEFQVLAEVFEKKTPEDIGILQNLALAYRKKGDVLAGFDSQAKRTKIPGKKNLSLAKINYQKSLEILRKTFPLALPNAEIKKIEKKLVERIRNS